MSWNPYYEKTKSSPPDPTLEFALRRPDQALPKIAIDCGCGAGRNAEFLRARGFEVYGFDPEAEAIEICQNRLEGDDAAHFKCDSFLSYDYPQASLTIAALSLFFCPAGEFEDSWKKISGSVMPGGVFCGTFLGPKDTWAISGDVFGNGTRPVISHSANEVRALFDGFEIEGFDERDVDGNTSVGIEKHWHTFMVTAKRMPA